MKKPYNVAVTVLVVVAFIWMPLFVSCSSHSEGSSFISELDEIDNYIAGGDTDEALSLLHKVSKKAYSSYARIGIYKRYMTLGEKTLAEKTIVKALKKIPGNQELTAVYTQFLLRDGRTNEALERSRILSGTQYGSLYAEALLRAAKDRGDDAASVFTPTKKYKVPKSRPPKVALAEEEKPVVPKEDFFRDQKLIPVYQDAYTGSKQTQWLRNAGVLYMKRGNYTDAVLIAPQKMDTVDDSLFWGTVYYDGGRYAESLDALLQIQNIPLYTGASFDTMPLEIAALEADDYYILGDEDFSQQQRERLLAGAESYIDSYELAARNPLAPPVFDVHLASIVPAVYINSARYAHIHSDVVDEYNMLSKLVLVFPDNVPGLAAFGQFALDTMNRPQEDSLLQELRRVGLRTTRMEQDDALPKIAVQIALEKIETALKKHNAPSLVVLHEQLLDVLDREASGEERIARLWSLLEKNETGTNLYPQEVLRYAVSRFISLGDAKDAHDLFNKYMVAQYGSGFVVSDHPQNLALWECETAAWFAAGAGNGVESRRLYEYIVDHYADRTPLLNGSGENSSLINAYVNLAVVYSSYDEDGKALDMLGKASARTVDPLKKAEILYRTAVLQSQSGDKNSAILSLKYVLQLNPAHNKARLLLRKLK